MDDDIKEHMNAIHSNDRVLQGKAFSSKKQQKQLVDGLVDRFKECIAEKNCTLIRYDILQGLRKLYDEVKDEKIREKALELIDTEEDLKYRKKYSTIWRIK